MRKLLGSVAALFAYAQVAALVHAPVFTGHIASPVHFGHAANSAFANMPVSGSSRAFQATIKSITGLTIKNTVLNTPLNGIGGQFSGVAYYQYGNATNGVYTNYTNFPATAFFGTGPLNQGYASGSPFVSSVGNVITSGIPTAKVNYINLFPAAGHSVSGAQRALQGYYNQAATNGYNGGISLLQHPTGGLLFGTTYYGTESYPGFLAFGNNYFASAAAAQNAFTNGLTLSTSTLSYIQFGKVFRPITSGIFTSTQYYNSPYNPPYSIVPGKLNNDGYFGIAIGSNPFNNFKLYNGLAFPYMSTVFLK